MKTIFITITRGMVARNILRAGVLDILAQNKDLRIVILIPRIKEKNIPDYFLKEFEKENVKIELVENKKMGKIERGFNHFISKLVFTKSTRLYLRFHIKEERRIGRLGFFLYCLVYSPLSKLKFLKKFIRFIDYLIFSGNAYTPYFEKYQPDLLLSTCIMSQLDITFLKEAKKRKIKTISMPRSWDNLDKFFFRVEPDLFLAQNERMKKAAQKVQTIDEDKIKVVGFPQFDLYANETTIISKNDYCQRKNFNPDLPILFLGSEGAWSKGDDKIFEQIIIARENKELPDCNILIRPHFSECDKHNYRELFKNYKNVYIDEDYRKLDFFNDRWDPSKEDMKDFANSLFHCNLMVTFASTLALDAVCFDKPIIGIEYGVKFIDGQDRTDLMYQTCHYEWVLETRAVSLVNNRDKLIDKINQYLKNPRHKEKERLEMKEKLCFKVDGKSSERIAEIVLSMIK